MSKTISKAGPKREDFRKIIDGKQVDLYILTNKKGAEMTVTNFGGKIVSLLVPDKNGKFTDVELGHNTIEEYEASTIRHLGSVCGRTCNRIAKGKFTLDGKEYKLAINNGPNSLHGGVKGFNEVVWDAKQTDDQTIVLTYVSPDGEEGFPGMLTVQMIYTLTDDNAVQIDYEAHTDKPTIINLTNHSFFNLSGDGDPTIHDHILTIYAETYLPSDETSIPYGDAEPVAGTPMDFRKPYVIGARINEKFEQLIFGHGYDNTYVLDKKPNELKLCAKLVSPKTGIVMDVLTTEPGVHLYTGNWLADEEGKGGRHYPRQSAICLETQHHPDSINKPSYPSVVLRPGETFTSQTIYKFYTE